MPTLSLPGGSVTGCAGSGGPIGFSSTPSTRRKSRHGGLRLIEHLGELGNRLEEPVREEDEADQRA